MSEKTGPPLVVEGVKSPSRLAGLQQRGMVESARQPLYKGIARRVVHLRSPRYAGVYPRAPHLQRVVEASRREVMYLPLASRDLDPINVHHDRRVVGEALAVFVV